MLHTYAQGCWERDDLNYRITTRNTGYMKFQLIQVSYFSHVSLELSFLIPFKVLIASIGKQRMVQQVEFSNQR